MNDIKQIIGYLEGVNADGLLAGWALNPTNPDENANVYVDINGVFFDVVFASQARDDLKQEGIREGRAGFTLSLDAVLQEHPGEYLEIRAFLDESRQFELKGSPLRINPAREEEVSTPIDAGLSTYPAVEGVAGRINCYFEGINNKGEIYGWAFDANKPLHKLAIHLFIEALPLGTCQAEQLRHDLREAGIGNGDCGFSFALSRLDQYHIKPGRFIHAYFDAERSHELVNSPWLITEESSQDILEKMARNQLRRLTGTFEGLNDRGELTGWAADPVDTDHKPVIYLYASQVLLGSVEASDFRGDLKDAGLGDGKCAFVWSDHTLRGLHALKRGLTITAWFDAARSRELSGSPQKITRQEARQLWARFMSSENMSGITLASQGKLLDELLLFRRFDQQDEELSPDSLYANSLMVCQALYGDKHHDELVALLNPNRLARRKLDGLPIFELQLYRIMSLASLQQLSFEIMDEFEREFYRETREWLVPPSISSRISDWESSLTENDADQADLPDPDKIKIQQGVDHTSSDKPELLELKTRTHAGYQAKDRRSCIVQYYQFFIRSACQENFKRVSTHFNTLNDMPDADGDRQQKKYLSRYAIVMARLLSEVYDDQHLALSFAGLLTRDTLPETPAEAYALSGRISQTLGHNYEALQYYLLAGRNKCLLWRVYHEAGVLFSMVCGNQIDLYRRNADRILQLLARGLELNPLQSAGFKLAENFIGEFVQTSMTHSDKLAKTGGAVDAALAQREQDLKRIATLLVDSRQQMGHFQAPPRGRVPIRRQYRNILFVASQFLWQCFYYRTKQKLDHARVSNWNTRYMDMDTLSDRHKWIRELQFADVLYVCRLPASYEVLDLMVYARNLGIPVIYDIDDLVFDEQHFPSPLASYAGTINKTLYVHLRLDNPLHRIAMLQADVVTCSTEPLAEQIRSIEGFDKTVVVYPNLLSEELVINAASVRSGHATPLNLPEVENAPDSVEIFYGSATKAHKQVFYEVLCPALAIIMASSPGVRVTLIGYFRLPRCLIGFSQRIKLLQPSPNYMGYIQRLRQADINIAILEQDVFTDCKSELKWFEAGVFGIPSVVTPTATYRHVLHPEDDVLFAVTTEDWIRQINRLVESASLRRQIGESARQHVMAHYRPETGVAILQNLLDTTLGQPRPTDRKLKILFVNVYFSPQSQGGATRIMESHIRHILSRHPDEFEIHVLTTEADPGHWEPYSLEQYPYGDALVTRLRIPLRDWADHEDEQVHAFCLEYYRRNEFDLIHFHSIQMLTASAVDAARELRIPYLITLHDGWWLSRYLFLMDARGQMIDPADPFSGSNAETDDLLWLLERKNRLYRCLHDAHTVLAVSETFRKLHEDAAISARLVTNENGLELFDILPRVPVPEGKVRVMHIGGMSVHKGYDLLQTVVTDGHFNNLEVTVIDHALEPGETYHDRWGTTPVKFMAKTRQGEVNQLYSQMDVLVAPSLWPESFGLVTREALYAGVWVIASDRGSVGDAIEDGVSGRVVDVSSPEGLTLALREVDANPEPYTRQRPSIKPRLAETQATECVELYRSILRNPVD